MHWILSGIGTAVGTVVLQAVLEAAIPSAWKRPDLRRRFAVVTFLLLTSLCWVLALGVLFSADHLGAATPRDATVVGIGLVVAGVVMCGFALIAAAQEARSGD